MKNYISGIVVVITGRTAGFGLSSAQILRELGAQVAVTGRNLERL